MRIMLSMTVGALALAGLAGCGQSEEAYRANLRTQALANCRTGANANPAAASQLAQIGLSVEQLCTCAIDRYMRGASYDQLKREQSNPSPAGLESASAQCVTEHMSRAGAAAMNAATTQATDAAADAERALNQATADVERAAGEVENATGEQ